MSRWTHAVCETCYARLEPGRVPLRLSSAGPPTACCRCGKALQDPIYYRADPKDGYLCEGHHEPKEPAKDA